MGSITVGAWIAALAFPTLLILGWQRGRLGRVGTTTLIALALIAWITLPRLMPGGSYLVTSALAALDIALVFIVFRGDVRIT